MNCPHCKKPDFKESCRFCGTTAWQNPSSGNTVYILRGKIVAAPDDLREQMAKRDPNLTIKGPDPQRFD